MSRGDTSLRNNEYDSYLASKAKGGSRSARQELEQRNADRRNAHDDSGIGYHFGLGNDVVKIESKEHLKKELGKRGLMLATDVSKNLRGPNKAEFKGRRK